MRIKKAGGKIYGMDLTSSERKAMDIEIHKELVDYSRHHEVEVNAVILWQLHEQLGFGPERLKKFYDGCSPAIKALTKRYEMDDKDQVWLCTHKLKEYGVNIENWK